MFSTLSLGARALQAHRTAAATASHNLQNASTAGYARQRATLATTDPESLAPVGFVGTGVRISGVGQARDRFVEARLPQLFASSAASQAQATALTAVTAFDREGGVNLGGDVAKVFSSLRELSLRPNDPATRRGAVASAQAFAVSVNRAGNEIESARAAIDDDIRGRVPDTNRALEAVARLNREIKIAAAQGGGPPNDLLDERQRAVDAAVQLTGAVVVPGKDGDVGLALKSGAALVVGDRASVLDVVNDADGRAVVRVDGDDVAGAAFSGFFGGAFAARDDDLGAVAAALDTAVVALRDAMNTAHGQGFDEAGNPGGAFFTGADARSFAIDPGLAADPSRLAIAATAASSGDAGALQFLLRVESQTNPAGALAGVAATFGARAAAAQQNADADDAVLAHGIAMREAASGVSVDEELVELQRSERAFQAASKVISTADSMLETLLNLKN